MSKSEATQTTDRLRFKRPKSRGEKSDGAKITAAPIQRQFPLAGSPPNIPLDLRVATVEISADPKEFDKTVEQTRRMYEINGWDLLTTWTKGGARENQIELRGKRFF
jgi:hypothetical protein